MLFKFSPNFGFPLFAGLNPLMNKICMFAWYLWLCIEKQIDDPKTGIINVYLSNLLCWPYWCVCFYGHINMHKCLWARMITRWLIKSDIWYFSKWWLLFRERYLTKILSTFYFLFLLIFTLPYFLLVSEFPKNPWNSLAPHLSFINIWDLCSDFQPCSTSV